MKNTRDIDLYRIILNWCFWTVVLEKTLESPLDCKQIQPVHPKGNQSWIFIGKTDVEAETPVLWPPDTKNWLIWKDPDAGKDWRQEEKGMTEDEMVGWHHWLNGHEFGWIPGVGDGQGSLVCCSPCGRRVGHNRTTVLWKRICRKRQTEELFQMKAMKEACQLNAVYDLVLDIGPQKNTFLFFLIWFHWVLVVALGLLVVACGI